ncbi:hypothetical protein BpHYR1_028046 [Brachionus plicatilis]|uniref:Uncharacterized protein n=1 Tax=Brachionus plicatilis TaxID=10195 RepID=A0A3M7SBS7_BRAPC|nr:hypothetical protein BpHYR1_028046 [Brachionus plicatilis]
MEIMQNYNCTTLDPKIIYIFNLSASFMIEFFYKKLEKIMKIIEDENFIFIINFVINNKRKKFFQCPFSQKFFYQIIKCLLMSPSFEN